MNGSADPKDVVIEPDGPSEVSQDDPDNDPKVISKRVGQFPGQVLYFPCIALDPSRRGVQRRTGRRQVGRQFRRGVQGAAAEGVGQPRRAPGDLQGHQRAAPLQGRHYRAGLRAVPPAAEFGAAAGRTHRAVHRARLLHSSSSTVRFCARMFSVNCELCLTF